MVRTCFNEKEFKLEQPPYLQHLFLFQVLRLGPPISYIDIFIHNWAALHRTEHFFFRLCGAGISSFEMRRGRSTNIISQTCTNVLVTNIILGSRSALRWKYINTYTHTHTRTHTHKHAHINAEGCLDVSKRCTIHVFSLRKKKKKKKSGLISEPWLALNVNLSKFTVL